MSTTSQRTNPRKLEKSGHCSAWKDGFCFQGNKCLYIHDIRVLDETREIRLTMLAAAQNEGLRRREEAEREVRERLLRNLRIQLAKEETSKTVQHVVLGSAMVSYGAGASVQHVLPGCNSCRIGVANLPLDATREEVEGLFTQQGIVPGTFCLLGLAKAPDGKHLEADVVIDKENGQMISIGLDGIEFRDELLGFEVSENDRPDGMQASATRGSDIITFSLRAPSSSMLVSFLSQAQAQERAQQLNRQMCAGRRVRVETNRYISGDPYFGETAVRITGLPLNVPLVKVIMFAGAGLLKVLNPVNYDVQEAFKLLRLSIEAIPGGRLEKYEIISGESVEGILLVKAHLGTWEHARKVHALLDGIRLPYLGGTSLKMRLPDPILYTLSVPLRQYEAQKRAWGSLTDAGNNSQACSIRIHLNDKAFIRVFGENRKAVGALKVRVEGLARGEKVVHWHNSFTSGQGEAFVSSVSSRTGLYVRTEARLRAFKLYGDPSAVEMARHMIRAEVERLNSLESTALLKQQCIGFFVRCGLGILQCRLGEANVTLDISSSPCQITVRGGAEAHDMLQRLVDVSLTDVDPSTQSETCPICYDDISHPVQLNCDHTYCSGCLRHFLATAAERKLFPLSCMGDEGACGVLIPIPMIQRHLLPSQFQHLLESAFLSYLEHHPQELKYCTTPDCRQIYRATDTPAVVSCPSCFSSICSCCTGDAHEGMSCEESRLHNDPAEQERLNDVWARENNVKTCPSCKIRIEKVDGCNHLACKCGAHICWKCQPVAMFHRDEIYEHLNAAHGGAFEED